MKMQSTGFLISYVGFSMHVPLELISKIYELISCPSVVFRCYINPAKGKSHSGLVA
jgi:hypothetical protein